VLARKVVEEVAEVQLLVSGDEPSIKRSGSLLGGLISDGLLARGASLL
jgi:hypothetical protein